MDEALSRFASLIGEESIETLARSRVMVFGLGGVGGSAVEALARAGIGEFDLIDGDVFEASNLNRQALSSIVTLGKNKAEVGKERILSINPKAVVHTYPYFYLPEDKKDIDILKADFVIDAIDMVKAKLDVIEQCYLYSVPLVSALGCGNRMDPSKFRLDDIHKTELDPLAKIVRKACREKGIKSLRVVYSTEAPIKPDASLMGGNSPFKRGSIPGSSPFVPPAAGLLLAYEAVRVLLEKGAKPK